MCQGWGNGQQQLVSVSFLTCITNSEYNDVYAFCELEVDSRKHNKEYPLNCGKPHLLVVWPTGHFPNLN